MNVTTHVPREYIIITEDMGVWELDETVSVALLRFWVPGSTPGGSEYQAGVKKTPLPAAMPKHERKVPARTHTGNSAPV